MPMKRGNVFYLKRRLPGIEGSAYKSLRTQSRTEARRLEGAILRLCNRGHQELVRTFLDGDLDAHRLCGGEPLNALNS